MIEIDDGQAYRSYREREARERTAAASTNDTALQQTHLQLAERYQQRARELAQRNGSAY